MISESDTEDMVIKSYVELYLKSLNESKSYKFIKIIKQKEIPYKRRDHELFIAFAPYKNPRYAVSIVIEHGGTGSSSAAPIAKKIIKKVLDRDQLRKKYHTNLLWDI